MRKKLHAPRYTRWLHRLYAHEVFCFCKKACGLLQPTPCAKAHVYRARSVFWHAHVAPENEFQFILSLRRQNSTRFFYARLGGTLFFFPHPRKMGKEKWRSNDRRTNTAYQTTPCLVNPLPVNSSSFLPVAQGRTGYFIQFPSLQAAGSCAII